MYCITAVLHRLICARQLVFFKIFSANKKSFVLCDDNVNNNKKRKKLAYQHQRCTKKWSRVLVYEQIALKINEQFGNEKKTLYF